MKEQNRGYEHGGLWAQKKECGSVSSVTGAPRWEGTGAESGRIKMKRMLSSKRQKQKGHSQ